MSFIRHRSIKPKATTHHGIGGEIDPCDDKKAVVMPSISGAAAQAVISVVVIALVATGIITNDSPKNQPPYPAMHKEFDSRVSLDRLPRFGPGNKTTPCPTEFKRKFYVDSNKINQPVIRALRMQGWKKIDNIKRAQVIWTYVSRPPKWYDRLEPWHRYNHMPNYKLWDSKDNFVTYMMKYKQESGKELSSIPETYRLNVASDLEKFKTRLFEEGGISMPWVLKKPNVNQGKGITILGPNTTELRNVLETVKADRDVPNYIIQRYICNEMTINKKKFDFRMFWLVASLNPLITMVHDGFVRIGNSEYNEQNFSNTQAHLTTLTYLADEDKASWDEFGGYLRDAVENDEKLKHIKDPVAHVKNQVKQALAEMAVAYKDVTFNLGNMPSENGFAFYGADFIVDWDLDVFFIEPQHGCGLDEDYQFRIEMHNSLFTEMIALTEEIWERQERGLPTDNASVKNVGGYEFVYNDGWMFEYEGYVRSKHKKGCEPIKK
jgi:Tubulin-tyrosine ligase family